MKQTINQRMVKFTSFLIKLMAIISIITVILCIIAKCPLEMVLGAILSLPVSILGIYVSNKLFKMLADDDLKSEIK